jgi:prepilin peptidase CpaA
VTVLTCVLWGFLAAATITDIRWQLIPNVITYPGIITAFVLRGWFSGWEGLEDGFAGFAACGAIMLVCLLMLGIGGGDLKLIAMMGAFLGLHQGFEALLWTLILGGVWGVCCLIWQIGIGSLLAGVVHHLGLMWRAKGWVPLATTERKVLKQPLFLAPSALVAAVIVAFSE